MREYESSKGIWDWNFASVRRRFERQRPDIPEVARHRSQKDKHRWCKGKVGKEHQPEEVPSRWGTYTITRCKVCGKYIDYDFAMCSPHWLIPRGM